MTLQVICPRAQREGTQLRREARDVRARAFVLVLFVCFQTRL